MKCQPPAVPVVPAGSAVPGFEDERYCTVSLCWRLLLRLTVPAQKGERKSRNVEPAVPGGNVLRLMRSSKTAGSRAPRRIRSELKAKAR